MLRYRVGYSWREFITDCSHVGAKNRAIDLICKDLDIKPTNHIRRYFTAAMAVEEMER